MIPRNLLTRLSGHGQEEKDFPKRHWLKKWCLYSLQISCPTFSILSTPIHELSSFSWLYPDNQQSMPPHHQLMVIWISIGFATIFTQISYFSPPEKVTHHRFKSSCALLLLYCIFLLLGSFCGLCLLVVRHGHCYVFISWVLAWIVFDGYNS